MEVLTVQKDPYIQIIERGRMREKERKIKKERERKLTWGVVNGSLGFCPSEERGERNL